MAKLPTEELGKEMNCVFKFRRGKRVAILHTALQKSSRLYLVLLSVRERERERRGERGLIHKLTNASDSKGVGKLLQICISNHCWFK